jgi:hypothetical protein
MVFLTRLLVLIGNIHIPPPQGNGYL